MAQRITPCLMFMKEAEEAANHYVSVFASVFGDSRILKVTRYGKEELEALKNMPGMTEEIMPGSPGDVSGVTFLLNGQKFMAANGGTYFGKFTESMSMYVECENQREIDELWERLTEGGSEQQCGWLKDRYGVSWQITPAILGQITEGPDREKAQRVTKALYTMKKIDLEKIMQAAKG